MRCGLVREEVVRSAGWPGVEAHCGADRVAGTDWQIDIPDALCPDLAGDILLRVDGHLDVNVEEAKTNEGSEEVSGGESAGNVLQVWYRPGDK